MVKLNLIGKKERDVRDASIAELRKEANKCKNLLLVETSQR